MTADPRPSAPSTILVLGGTTEGRQAVEVLEQAARPYFYSTKTGEQTVALHHGQPISGGMDGEAMVRFCREHQVGLLVDAAHPFAQQLHQVVAATARELLIPAVRLERRYPPRDARIHWFPTIEAFCAQAAQLVRARQAGQPPTLLATTGVQTIGRLKPLEAQGLRVRYRILPRPSSLSLARQQGATPQQLCYYEEGADELAALRALSPDALLVKESGASGGFPQKVEAALQLGITVIAIERPPLPLMFTIVHGPVGLRRAVERQLPGFFALRSGLTTGTCATAAAVAAAQRLLTGACPPEVEVVLPSGEPISVAVGYGPDDAFAVKDGGDDPDVTSGLEIHARVEPATHFQIVGGEGVGRFTLPGFDYPPGEAAINRVPRQMIEENLRKLSTLKVTISVPGGAEVARRTFNPRLGIEGGISIIGVSGVVQPFSEEAFLESIHKCMEVALASGSRHVVINSGAKSERHLRPLFPLLPSQAFVQYGNYIGATLQMAHELGFHRVTLGVMLGKAVKLASGHLDTHSRLSTWDRPFAEQLLKEAGCRLDLSSVTLARELWALLPEEKIADFCRVLIAHCRHHCQPLLPQEELSILLIDEEGGVHS